MTDRWSNADDRSDRGRVNRGVHGSRHSRSPVSRHSEFVREPKPRDRSRDSVRSTQHRDQRQRDRSPDRRRRSSRSPARERREERPHSVSRGRNKGRELLNAHGSSNSQSATERRTSPSSKRRKPPTPSPPRSIRKKSRKDISRSPVRAEDKSARLGRRRSATPPRQDSTDRGPPPSRAIDRARQRGDIRDSRDLQGRAYNESRDQRFFENRRRSPSPRYRQGVRNEYRRDDYRSGFEQPRNRGRSPLPPQSFRGRSAERPKDYARSREQSPGRRTPLTDNYEATRSDLASSGPPRGLGWNRDPSPSRVREDRNIEFKNRATRKRSPILSVPREPKATIVDKSRQEENRPKPFEHRGKPSRPKTSGANSIEVPRDKRRSSKSESRNGTPQPSGVNSVEVGSSRVRRSVTPSSANGVEVNSEKMAGRGYYGSQPAFNQQQQQMQAAFPLKQYQSPQLDPRQYSQSPQHMTPGSYHGSPQAQSPYSNNAGGNWGPPQQQYSPQP